MCVTLHTRTVSVSQYKSKCMHIVRKFIVGYVNKFASESVGMWCMCKVLDECT